MFGNQFLNLGAAGQGDARVEATWAVQNVSDDVISCLGKLLLSALHCVRHKGCVSMSYSYFSEVCIKSFIVSLQGFGE